MKKVVNHVLAQYRTDGENAGFTTAEKPWFSINENYKTVNAAQQEQDPDSILHFYRKAIALRKSLPVVRHGVYREHFPLSGTLYCYSRETDTQKLLVLCSFSKKPQPLRFPRGFDRGTAKLVLQNYTALQARHPPALRVPGVSVGIRNTKAV